MPPAAFPSVLVRIHYNKKKARRQGFPAAERKNRESLFVGAAVPAEPVVGLIVHTAFLADPVAAGRRRGSGRGSGGGGSRGTGSQLFLLLGEDDQVVIRCHQ